MNPALQYVGSAGAGAIVACLVALAFIALLPRIFFRTGRLNARWWLTASPFAVAGATLVAGGSGFLRALALGGAQRSGIDTAGAGAAAAAVAAIALASAAIALIGYTLGSHTRPVSLWHQENDRPDRLVTSGAYARVRHPFYASFLLALLASLLAFPHPLTALALLAGIVQLNRTAAREERRLRDAFGEEYETYMRRTGRFWPRPLAARGPGGDRVGTPAEAGTLLLRNSD